MMFEVVWEDCIQDKTRVANREALLKEDDQALATHTKKRRSQPNFRRRNLSKCMMHFPKFMKETTSI